MNTIETIKAELLDLHNQASQIQVTADSEQRGLTPEENDRLDVLLGQFREADMELTRLENKSQGRITEPQPVYNGNQSKPAKPLLRASQAKPFAGRRMADLFSKSAVNDPEGWESADEFLSTVANGLSHKSLKASSMSEGVGSDGGFVVPTFLVSRLLDESLENELVRPLSTVFPMMSNELTIAGIDSANRTSTIGGLDAVWMAELDAATKQKATFRKLTLRAKKLAIFCQASSEVAEDGLNFEQQLTAAMTRSLTYDLDAAFINGTGTGQPTGVMNSNS
jgi:HK97 family phage major capsid protein